MEIREVTPEDMAQLQEIGRRTFVETYSSVNTEENMSNYLAENLSIDKLMSEFSDKHMEFYFALMNERIVGFLKLNSGEAQTEPNQENSLEIERIYVLSEFQGKGVGQFLFEKTVELANERKLDYVWLGVWEQNSKAIGFYKKNGFLEFGKHIFFLGNDEQQDILMKLDLKK